ncbi:MAG: hypothetical protein ACLPTL_11845, partial [Steroidobacteraceae bacterium]
MKILTQRDHVEDEMPRRGRARIAGSAIAARFGRFADCPPSAQITPRYHLQRFASPFGQAHLTIAAAIAGSSRVL